MQLFHPMWHLKQEISGHHLQDLRTTLHLNASQKGGMLAVKRNFDSQSKVFYFKGGYGQV